MGKQKVPWLNLDPFLGFYDVQLEALQALMKAMNKAYDIPFVCPRQHQTEQHQPEFPRPQPLAGSMASFHTIIEEKTKIDCAGLDLKQLLEELK